MKSKIRNKPLKKKFKYPVVVKEYLTIERNAQAVYSQKLDIPFHRNMRLQTYTHKLSNTKGLDNKSQLGVWQFNYEKKI